VTQEALCTHLPENISWNVHFTGHFFELKFILAVWVVIWTLQKMNKTSVLVIWAKNSRKIWSQKLQHFYRCVHSWLWCMNPDCRKSASLGKSGPRLNFMCGSMQFHGIMKLIHVHDCCNPVHNWDNISIWKSKAQQRRGLFHAQKGKFVSASWLFLANFWVCMKKSELDHDTNKSWWLGTNN